MVEGIYWFLMSWAICGLFHEYTKEYPTDDRPQRIVYLRRNNGPKAHLDGGQV